MDCFFELNFSSVSKILLSSKLNITSEVEVYHAANNWLSYSYEKRCKFAKCIFLKVRMSLLSENSLNKILSCSKKLRKRSSFHKNEECLEIINSVLDDREQFYRNKPGHYQTHRHCDHEMFSLVLNQAKSSVFNFEYANNMLYYNGPKFNNVRVFAKITKNERYYGVAYVNGCLHVLDGLSWLVRKYSFETRTWKVVAGNNKIRCKSFRLCVFMDKIILSGGYYYEKPAATSFCYALNTNNYKWKKRRRMQVNRASHACAVFQGRIVVSGGFNSYNVINKVESYDHASDSWSYMSRMNERRRDHSMMATKEKLFVVGYYANCEVYDVESEKFVILKKPPQSFKFQLEHTTGDSAVSIGKKIVVFGRDSETVAFYDTDKDEWSEVPFRGARYVYYTCLKIPQIFCTE